MRLARSAWRGSGTWRWRYASNETILIWFRLSAEIEPGPITVSAHSNRGIKLCISKSFSFKYIIPGSASAAEVPQDAHNHDQCNKTANHTSDYGSDISA